MSDAQEDMQYAKMGKVLFPVGATVRRLPAGFYNIERGLAGYGIVPAAPVSDELIELGDRPGDAAFEVMQDIKKFLGTKDRYMRAGLTHKRGYLFYGPPGTGKTSLGLLIARRFVKEADGVVFYIPASGILQLAANIIRQVEPGRPTLFLMEEADGFVNDVGALSVLDGELSLAGAVFVAMTNYKDKMPPRITQRPGRFDRVMYVGAPDHRVQVEYLKKLAERLGDTEVDVAERIALGLQGLEISMAHLREAFVSHVLMDVPMEVVAGRFQRMQDGDGEGEDSDDDDSDEDEEGIGRTCPKCDCEIDRMNECCCSPDDEDE